MFLIALVRGASAAVNASPTASSMESERSAAHAARKVGPPNLTRAASSATLNQAGDAWAGVFKFDVIAPNGAIVFSGSGTHGATRIRVEPL